MIQTNKSQSKFNIQLILLHKIICNYEFIYRYCTSVDIMAQHNTCKIEAKYL